MKFGVVCDVDSKIFIGSGSTLALGRKKFILYVHHETGFINQIRVISDVGNPGDYYLHEVPPQNRKFAENFNYEISLKDELIGDLQLIESILALMGNMKRVHWHRPTFEYYPETEAEHAQIEITPSWFFLWEFLRDDPTELNLAGFRKAMIGADFLRPLAPLMSFYREGMNDYRGGRYINAFFNFYFIIEGLFADGKSRSNEVIRAYEESPVLKPLVDAVINEVGANNDPSEGMTREQLEGDLKQRDQPFTSDGLIRFLVKKRGELHHFSLGSSRQQGTPLNHFHYKRIAFIVCELAGKSLIHQIGEAEKRQNEESDTAQDVSAL